MSTKSACDWCSKGDKNRTKDGKIRCTRYSKWVYPFEDSCEEYADAKLQEFIHNNFKHKENREER